MGFSIDTVYAAGDDSLSNQWDLILPSFPGSIDVNNTMIRVTDFDVPEIAINTYTINYKTQALTKPSGKNKTPNTLTFTFRIDKYWQTYEGFENWKNLILNDDTGAMSPDVSLGAASLIRVPIDVIPTDTNNVQTKKGWTFTGCYITSLAGVKFDQEGSPLSAQVTMDFIKKINRV